MTFENFVYEQKGGGVGVLFINRPKALNALSSAVLNEFSKALKELSQYKELKCLIVTGSGDKAFIAGADIAEMSALSKVQAREFAERGQEVTMLLETFPCPVIAAVNGFALGGGCEIALACDFLIATTKAVFGQPEVCLGLITGFGGAVRLADYVGWPMARELIYTGRRINAEEALRLGLVSKVVAPETLMDTALMVAQEIGGNSPLAVRAIKSAMLKIRSTADVKARLQIEAQAFGNIFESHDQKEGTKAFLEKRKPLYKGE